MTLDEPRCLLSGSFPLLVTLQDHIPNTYASDLVDRDDGRGWTLEVEGDGYESVIATLLHSLTTGGW